MATETVSDLANNAIAQQDVASARPLEQAAKDRSAKDVGVPEAQSDFIWGKLPAEQCLATTANIDVYLYNFISVVHGGPKERRQLLRRLFHKIDRLFRLNEDAGTDRKEPISLNKLGQEDGACSSRKIVLGWNLDTVAHLLRLLPRRQDKVEV